MRGISCAPTVCSRRELRIVLEEGGHNEESSPRIVVGYQMAKAEAWSFRSTMATAANRKHTEGIYLILCHEEPNRAVRS